MVHKVLKSFRKGKTFAQAIKEGRGKYKVEHYYDSVLQYEGKWTDKRDALGDINCLISEFKGVK